MITQTALFVKIKAGHDEYLRDLIEFNETFSSLSDDISINVEKKERGELYVIVIGESESRDFVYADQGPYPNSPWRSQIKQDQSWIFFTNAYSSHTHTVPVLTAALGEGREISGRTFPKGVTLPGISRKAGIKTFWISNQAALGSWDTPVAALAYQCDETVFISPVVKSFTSGVRKPDSFLLPAIEEVFSKIDSSQNNLVIIHLMGSHSPYEYRYPKDYPGLDMRNKGNLGNERETNNYRSLLLQQYLTNIQFTDSVLKDIFGAVKKYAPERAFMLYFADHGEDIYSKDGYHDIAHFTWTKARIPMMLWMSDKYRQENSSRLKQLQANAGRIFTNDLVFDLYLGLANIKVQGFTDKYDISGANYSLNADNAIITGGRKIKDDPFYIMASNIAADTSKKLTMHRANAVFKATRGQKLGLKNFEVDLVFEEGPSGARFMVGHGDEGMSGFSLEQWLDGLVEKPEFLWLDVKNLSSKNASQMLQHLEALDSRYGLKQFALLESYSIGDLTNFTKKGWKTSWYLPWERLIAAVESSDTFAINDLAAKAHKHQVSAVSYDLKADAAVREHLLRLLPEGTLLFAWHTPFSFFDSKLLDKIKDLQHLEKLLISFSSPYYI